MASSSGGSNLPSAIRHFLPAIGFATLIGACAFRSRYWEPFNFVVERIDIPTPANHPGIKGLKIGFLTDFHVGPFFSGKDAELAVDLILSEDPDIVLLGGDYISDSVRYLDRLGPAISKIAIAAQHGVFAVMGNHDLSLSRRKVSGFLQEFGIQVLKNEAARLRVNDHPLWIVGVDDTLLGTPDLAIAMNAVPAGQPKIVLWHEPAFANETANYGAILQLSGHSHGGQVKFPGLPPLWVPPHGKPFPAGLAFVQGMPVYTSRGIGIYRPPVRFNCPPEATVVTFQ